MAESAESRTEQVRAATVGSLGPDRVVPPHPPPRFHRLARQLHRDLGKGSVGSRKEARFLSREPHEGAWGLAECVCVFRF